MRNIKNFDFKRDIAALEKEAVQWWPSFLAEKESSTSIIPALLESQDGFVSILNLVSEDPFNVFKIIEASKFPANLFLKHLAVLADFGGEQMQRLNKNFNSIVSVKNKAHYFTFHWNEKNYKYSFKSIPFRGVLNNTRLGIDGPGLRENQPLDDLKADMIAILLFGSSAIDISDGSILHKCEIGTLLEKKEELEKYIKQKYIWVSRITGGAHANSLGQVAQDYLVETLKSYLPKYKVVRNGVIATRGGKIPFDVVVSGKNESVGIELTFQVTTNSTIERKAGQAAGRQKFLHDAGHFIAYVIDGAGNFQRRSAIATICGSSDCTVAYSPQEFMVLAEFIKKVLP
jgi:hypothetical protein